MADEEAPGPRAKLQQETSGADIDFTLIAKFWDPGVSLRFDGARIAEGHWEPSRNTVEFRNSLAEATKAPELPLTSFSSLQTIESAFGNDLGCFVHHMREAQKWTRNSEC